MTGWAVSQGYVGYLEAVAAMEAHVAAMLEGRACELVWLLEHPPLYTKGASGRDSDVLAPDRLPMFATRRGGQITYHGPGQRVAYVMLDLTGEGAGRGRDVKAFVCSLEQWIIDALAEFNIKGERRAGRVGVWIDRTRPGAETREDKIAAIGVRLKRWVSFHGISLNVEPDLDHFQGITPCGVSDKRYGVTSLADLGQIIPMHEADVALKRAFEAHFGPVQRVEAPV